MLLFGAFKRLSSRHGQLCGFLMQQGRQGYLNAPNRLWIFGQAFKKNSGCVPNSLIDWDQILCDRLKSLLKCDRLLEIGEWRVFALR